MSDTTSRRDFLRTTAGVAAALTFPAEELLADPRPVPAALPRAPLGADEPVRIGIIGTGGMGTGHLESFVNAAKDGRANLQIAALADVCQPRLAEAKKKAEAVQGPGVDSYTHYPELLARKDIHGVLIASPEHWHAKMAEDAILAGKDVYVEKPMTLHLKDALRLRQVVEQHPQVIANVGTQFVVSPSTVEAKKLIAEGAIGTPVWSQTSYCRNSKDGEWLYYGIDPAWQPGVNLDWDAWCGPSGKAPWNPEVYARWRRYRHYSTGIIGDLLVHKMTPLLAAMDLGWPTRVVAAGGHFVDKKMENHDQVNLTIQFEKEHTMIVAGSTANERGLETLIRGHKANLYFDGRTTKLVPEQLFANDVEERTVIGEDHGDDQDVLRLKWLECIRTREPSPSPVDLGTRVMVIVDLATRSMWEGGAFEFDPQSLKVRKI
jgi:predicted dehydrogenase